MALPASIVNISTVQPDGCCVRVPVSLSLVWLQGVRHFKDIQYTPTMTYGELLLQNEYEMSCYNMDTADVQTQQQMFQLHEQV